MAASGGGTSRDIVRRLLVRQGDDRRAEQSGEALRRVCTSVTENLRESLGPDGCDALIARALARTQMEHPALKELPRGKGAGTDLDTAVAGDAVHTPAMAAALEALLTAVIEILARLIGDDMATRIIDPDGAQNHEQDHAQDRDGEGRSS